LLLRNAIICYFLFTKLGNPCWGKQFWHILSFLFIYQWNPKTQTQNVCFTFLYLFLSLFIFYTVDVLKKACAVISFILSSITVRFWTIIRIHWSISVKLPSVTTQKTVQQFFWVVTRRNFVSQTHSDVANRDSRNLQFFFLTRVDCQFASRKEKLVHCIQFQEPEATGGSIKVKLHKRHNLY
jgi:hypothetical protein